MAQDGNSKVRWDPTVSLGTLVAMGGIAISVIGVGAVTLRSVTDMETTVKQQGEVTNQKFDTLSSQVQKIEVRLERSDMLQEQVRDLKNVISGLEQRLREVENR